MTEKFNSYVLYQSFGPISVSHYMRLCLNHPAFGYYTSDNVFGKKGDFITAPEINQIFGEVNQILLVEYILLLDYRCIFLELSIKISQI